MPDKIKVKKVSIPKGTEPKEFYYDEEKGVMVFEKRKKHE